MRRLIYKVDSSDNVGTALDYLRKNEEYPIFEEGKGIIGKVKLKTDIPKWYKVSLNKIYEDEDIIKFGFPIGKSVIDIDEGVVVHFTNIILDPDLDFYSLITKGFILGDALTDIKRGEIIKIRKNFMPIHPLIKDFKGRSRIGVAAINIGGSTNIRLGNMVDITRRLGWNEKYRRMVRDFYRFLRLGLIDFSRM